jgi:hypothetical protein
LNCGGPRAVKVDQAAQSPAIAKAYDEKPVLADTDADLIIWDG